MIFVVFLSVLASWWQKKNGHQGTKSPGIHQVKQLMNV